MSIRKQENLLSRKKTTLVLATAQAVLLIFGSNSVSANECKKAVKQLRGNYEVIQAGGGIWGFLEKSAALRDRSVLGLQIDSKLQRAVLSFENKCEDPNAAPDTAMFQRVGEFLDKGHKLNSKSADTIPAAQLIAEIQDMIKSLDEFLATVEKQP